MSNEIANVYGNKPETVSAASVTAAMATTRQAQEVQAAMIVAKHFPRDERASCDRILNACTRRSLAEGAIYSYSRGGIPDRARFSAYPTAATRKKGRSR